MPTDPVDRLAAYVERDRHSTDRHRRPREGRLPDSDGHPLFFMLPAPVRMARTFAAPLLAATRDLYRPERVGVVLVRSRDADTSTPPTPADAAALAEELASALRGLPERPDARDTYGYVRQWIALAAPADVHAYCVEVIAALGRPAGGLDPWHAPRPARPRSTKTVRDYQREQTARHREQARYVVHRWAASVSSGRWKAADVWRAYTAAMENARGSRVESDYPGAYLIGSRAFLALLRERFDVRPGAGGFQYVTIPDPAAAVVAPPAMKETPMDHLTAINAEADAYERAADAGARLLAIREHLAAGDRTAALTRGGFANAATGTDGVTDLTAYRTRR